MKLDDEQANPYRAPQAPAERAPAVSEIRPRLSAGIRFLLGAATGIVAVAALALFALIVIWITD